MADETVTTGTVETPPPAPETTPGGTEPPAGEGPEGKVSISAHEYGVLRDARAREKALDDEVKRLKADAEARTTPITDTRAADTSDMSEAEIKAYKAELHTSWKGGSRDAGAVLAGIISSERATASNRQLLYEIQMRDIPETQREAVKKHMTETGAPTPALAYRLMRGDSAATMEQRIVTLEKELAEAKKGKPKVEGTRIAGLPAGETADDGVLFKTLAEYNEMMTKDPNKTIAERRAGKFRLKDS